MHAHASGPIVVTGAGGFLGRAVLRALRSAGCEVRAYGGPSGTAPAAGDTLPRLDVRDAEAVRAAVTGASAVLHLAAIGGARAAAHPDETTEVNARGTLGVALAAVSAGVGRLTYVSTHAVYADRPAPLDESAPLEPSSVYAASKLAGEHLGAAACRGTSTIFTALRCFNLHGPEAPAENVVARMRAAALARGTFAVAGPADRRLDLLHIDDAAAAIVGLLALPSVPSVVNIGTGMGTSFRELAQWAAAETGRPPRLRADAAVGAPRHDRIADPTRLHQLLPAWRPRAFALPDAGRSAA